ncbi:MAG: Fe-S-containing protein [Thermodesulfovibrionales bacterium]
MARKKLSRSGRGIQSVYFFLLVFIFLVSCSRQPVYPEAPLKGSEVIIDANRLQSESPLFFTYRYHGKNINFFVLKVHDKVLSFLDACRTCDSSKSGYRVDNGYITCGACGVRYSLSEVETGVGSCWPIRIEGQLRDGEYHIPVSRLESFQQ